MSVNTRTATRNAALGHARADNHPTRPRGHSVKAEGHRSQANGHTTSANGSASPKHENFLGHIPKRIRGHVVAMIGEFVGTLLFLFFAFAGTQVANVSSNTNTNGTIITTVEQKTPAQLLYISLSFGFSLAVNAWVFFRVSGGLFNPAVC